ncbi:hypothetical protein F0562_017601 [Nyssa sinensis]|uniref:CCHC-type domain-containing protein n=1 Tax=Nyssa sinensis TaxID=561372 RepID=A0A5J4ZIC1_9ASTE|nr:hypothetical protein F0562_017601 [Nyssa sinensis]
MGGSRPIPESSAMLANQTRQGPSLGSSKTRNNQPPAKFSGLVCSHCGETGHSKQRCYEIIGYPEWWDFTKKPRKKIAGKAMVTSTKEDQSPPTANVAHPRDTPDMAESSMPSDLPMFTPSTEESTQNVLPQVTSNPSIDESNEIPDFEKCIAPEYSQRSNKGVPKK